MKLLFWIVVALVATLLALFAATNRESVTLGLWPLSFVLDLPLYLAILAALLIGFIAGTLGAWVAGLRGRRDLRRRGRRITALERELAATQARIAVAGESAATRLAAQD